ncbi:MAG: response regulator transcription factor [Tissierellia bacterium]|nr:response regulator transcription factor [Tissierellia bacterium]
MAKILIVEDDIDINELIADKCGREGYEYRSCYSGTEAELVLSLEKFDIVLLDLMLPGIKGENLLNLIKVKYDMPIIVISAKDSVNTKVDLLNAGADDYITKPFDLNELFARIAVQLRKPNQLNKRIITGSFCLDEESGQIFFGDNEIILPLLEFKILSLFIKYPKKVFSKANLYESCWGQNYSSDENTVNVHISSLRKRLKRYTDREIIETVWGMGFRLKI